jgi:DNA-binding FadR family transcriptional regulator
MGEFAREIRVLRSRAAMVYNSDKMAETARRSKRCGSLGDARAPPSGGIRCGSNGRIRGNIRRMPSKKILRNKSGARVHGEAMRLHGTIAQDLGVGIVSGRYKPGTILDNEIEASERLQVSRSAYREAVRILNAKGLVHSRPKVGTRVSQPEDWHLLDPDVLSWIFEFQPDQGLLADLFELRKVVEPQAASLAAVRRKPEHLQRMKTALEGMAKHSLSTRAGQIADHDFHSALLQATGNAFIMSLTSGIGAAITWTTVFKQRNNALRRDPVPDHKRVYDAIEAGDSQAAHKAMYTLVDLAFLETKTIALGRKKPR